MTSREGPSLDVLREAARKAVAVSGLRPVAREIGTTHYALRRFVEGGRRQPYAATEAKLRAWYERTHAPEILRAFRVIMDPVPENRREGAAREMLEALRRIYLQTGVEPPPWMEEMLEN